MADFYQYQDYGAEGVPDLVRQFVVYFYRHIRERNVREIYSMFDLSFSKLSERFFKGTTWPAAESISHLVDHDHVFCLLYKEMYYRHLYATLAQPTLEQRRKSWENYVRLFNIMLNTQVNMQLPNGWLWGMVDEFVYQFQSFQQYRGKLSQKSAEELAQLRECGQVWDIGTVLNYLQAFVDKSGIVAELSSSGKAEQLWETEGYDSRGSNVMHMLGYFSLVGLQRVHALIGDYHTALAVLHPIHPFHKAKLFAQKVPGCNIALYYNTAFCYLMQRRYLDAARAFNTGLAYINRVKQGLSSSPQYPQVLKKNEQMYALLAVVLALCPAAQGSLEESVTSQLREKYGEKIARMVRGSAEQMYEELFTYACPKFINAAPPTLDAPTANTNQEVYRLQLRCFLGLVMEQRHLPALKLLLKLYTSISLPKLAGLMDMEEPALRSQLLLLKSASLCKTWQGEGDATAGAVQSCAEFQFYLETDAKSGTEVVHVSETKQAQRQPEFLVKHIQRLQDIQKELVRPGAAAARKPPAIPSF